MSDVIEHEVTREHADVAPKSRLERRSLGDLAARFGSYGPLAAWLLAILIFSVLRPETFATWVNLRTIASDRAILAVAALGITVPLICGQFDLSLGATMGLTGLFVAGLISRSSVPWVLAVLIGVAIGAAIGAINGILVSYWGVHSFIATLGTATIMSGITLWYSNGQIIFENIPTAFSDVMRRAAWDVPLPIFYIAVITLVVWFVLTQTPFGRHLYAIGGNRAAAENAGIHVRRVIFYSLVVSGSLAGLAGIMLTSRTASSQTSAGDTFLLPAFAAAFIGAATLRRGEFNALGTVLGVYFVGTLVAGAFILGASDYVNPIISGSALIIAVLGNRALARKT
jgi:ribose transport system permease protein